jgi:hypothetical protein
MYGLGGFAKSSFYYHKTMVLEDSQFHISILLLLLLGLYMVCLAHLTQPGRPIKPGGSRSRYCDNVNVMTFS